MDSSDSELLDWPGRVERTLSRYSEPLLRTVADSLVKPRSKFPVADLVTKCLATLTNPPVIDRRVNDLPDGGRKVLAAVARSGQPEWSVGQVATLSAALGHAEGVEPVKALLLAGLVYPAVRDDGREIWDFDLWLASAGGVRATVFVPPAVAERARAEAPGLPTLEAESLAGPAREADGLDWPLRLAAVWQAVAAEPVRKTIAGVLFKKDRGRFEPTGLFALPDPVHAPADTGLLALAWAEAAGLLKLEGEALVAAPFPPRWDGTLPDLVAGLTADLFLLKTWDPILGETDGENPVPPFPTALLLSMLLLATAPAGKWVSPTAVADWLWEHHPGWQAGLPKEAARRHGRPWVDATLLGLAHPLGLVDVFPRPDDPLVRLSPLGRHLFAGGPKPHAPAAFPQTLLVQPNAEILAYRQGLTPTLVSFLTRVAAWKGIGPACTLELTQDQTYRGLESGLTVAEVLQTLARHSTRPVPPAVDDLLRRWATKRERVTVFASATLVEFANPADLDAAIARGVVSIKLTDRIGLTADGKEPDFRHLRLTGNRDYESRPIPCLTVEPDGITLVPDPATADLLIEPELLRIAEPIPGDPPGVRRFRLTPDKVRAAANGAGLDDLDGWFQARSGTGLPAPARLFAAGPNVRPAKVERLVVLRFQSPEITDGVCQWPVTADRVADRLGPTTVAVDELDLASLVSALSEIGVGVETSADEKVL
jgi:hypothetical protein